MQVILSGYTGRATNVADVPRKDGSGSFKVAETSLAVTVAEDVSDWYKLKFVGDSLVKAASYIGKGALLSVAGTLSFENWDDEDGTRRSRPVLTVSEVQLPPRTAASF